MITLKPLKRKSDILDELDFLRYRRRIAYEKGDRDVVTLINLEIKAFRIANDWDEGDTEAEFVENEKEAAVPFSALKGNDRIRYDLFDENHKAKGFRLTIKELSIYSARRDFGISHYEALLAV
jgi:hypothetical protein